MGVRTVLEFLKIEHSLFALPFVLAGFVLGLRTAGLPLAPDPQTLLDLGLVLVAAVSARTAAMTVNRIIDRAIDAKNPRTADRHLPKGSLSVAFASTLAVVAFGVLGASSWLLNPLCFALSPLLVALFLAYPYAKRYTWACHLVLGLAFLCAPAGGYLAVTGAFVDFVPVLLVGLAAMAWVAGFDVIYALLDVDFDRRTGIHSIPADFGVGTGRLVAIGLHGATVVFLAAAGLALALPSPWWIGLAIVAGLLAYEHATVDPDDYVAINKAFFNVNAVVGWIVLAGLLAGLAL